MINYIKKWVLFVVIGFATVLPAMGQQDEPKPNQLQKFMFYRSFVQDASNCSVDVQNGQASLSLRGGLNVTTCPDAFAWAWLANAISGKFWNWGIDQTVWPNNPLPLCKSKTDKKNCCDPNTMNPNNQPTQCPVYRADYSPISPLPAIPSGSPSANVINHRGLSDDPGRLLRDLELELVFRNKPMVDYIYRNDLYSQEGLGARNRAQNAHLKSGNIAKAHALSVSFPVGSVTVKVDFVHQEVMLDTGLIRHILGEKIPNNPKYPYITVYLKGDGSKGQVPGYYYLVAMTNNSKDIPIWHWYAIEHVANLGRCDYIGCNDSFGYTSNPTAQKGANFGTSFIPPMIQLNDDKTDRNDPLFVTGKFYDPNKTGERITSELQKLFKAMGIADGVRNPSLGTTYASILSAHDPAWLNYRLKGTQTTFTTASGIPTGMGGNRNRRWICKLSVLHNLS